MEYAALLIGVGLGGGFAAGLLGLGGSTLLVPFLLAIPPYAGHPPLTASTVLAASLLQVLVAAGAATLLKPSGLAPQRPAELLTGALSAAAALGGALLSAVISAGGQLWLFALAAGAATLQLLLRGRARRPRELADDAQRRGFAGLTSGLTAALTGLGLGLVGSAGGLLLAPLLQDRFDPVAAVGRGPVARIILAGALAGLLGKLLTRQVDPGLAAALVLGAFPGAWWGGEVAERLDQRHLGWAALTTAAAATLWIWGELLMYPSS